MKSNIDLTSLPCYKNPGHASFIPSSKFNVNHLPLQYQDTDLANCVTSMIDLCVSVAVEYVSESRPEFMPGTDRPYPYFSKRGRHIKSVGSGWVHTVYRFPDKYNTQHKTCLCKECLRSETPNPHFAFIVMGTATHLVFDDSEGEHARCLLFYKEGATPDTCSDAIELRGMWRVIADIISDRCLMIHVTHDMDLASRLDKNVLYRDYLKDIYVNKCLLYNPPEEAHNDQDLLVVLVSHPHGFGSHVSIGFERGTEEVKAGRIKYKYDTSTCPGCSGGKIFVVWKDWKSWGFEHTHSGQSGSRLDINYSSSGIGFLPLTQSQAGNGRTETPAKSEPAQDTEGNGRTESPSKAVPAQVTEGSAEVEECLAETELHDTSRDCKKKYRPQKLYSYTRV